MLSSGGPPYGILFRKCLKRVEINGRVLMSRSGGIFASWTGADREAAHLARALMTAWPGLCTPWKAQLVCNGRKLRSFGEIGKVERKIRVNKNIEGAFFIICRGAAENSFGFGCSFASSNIQETENVRAPPVPVRFAPRP